MGYLLTWGQEGKQLLEMDTVGCSHCQKVLPKKVVDGGGQWRLCMGCGKPVCVPCFAKSQGGERVELLVVRGTPHLIKATGCRTYKQHIDEAWDLLHRSRI